MAADGPLAENPLISHSSQFADSRDGVQSIEHETAFTLSLSGSPSMKPLPAALTLIACLTLPGGALAVDACALIAAQEAAAIAGAALPENYHMGARPGAAAAQPQASVCGWFPQQYRYGVEEDPPESGVLLTLRNMQSPAEARAFFERGNQMAGKVNTPGRSGAAVPITGIGDTANLIRQPLNGNYVLTLKFLKGAAIAYIQVWTRDASAGDTLIKVAKQMASKL